MLAKNNIPRVLYIPLFFLPNISHVIGRSLNEIKFCKGKKVYNSYDTFTLYFSFLVFGTKNYVFQI